MSKFAIRLDYGTESGRALVVDVATARVVGTAVYRYADGVIDEHLPGTTIKLEPDSALQNPVEIGTPIIEVRRLRLVEGEPIAVVTSYLPHKYTQKLEKVDLTNHSFYEFLENEFKLNILQAHRAIEAVPAGEADARLLKIKPGDPVLRLESTSYLDDGKPIEYFEAFHRGDRTRFEIQLIRVRDQWRAFE